MLSATPTLLATMTLPMKYGYPLLSRGMPLRNPTSASCMAEAAASLKILLDGAHVVQHRRE